MPDVDDAVNRRLPPFAALDGSGGGARPNAKFPGIVARNGILYIGVGFLAEAGKLAERRPRGSSVIEGERFYFGS